MRAYYALEYLRTRKLADSGVEVSVTAEKLKQPARLGNFQIGVQCPVKLTEEQQLAMRRSIQQCLVHNTMLSHPNIEIELTMRADASLSPLEAGLASKDAGI